jgi:hypothetical protein
MQPPIGGRRRVYNEQERKVIDPFKDAYMKTETPAERKAIAQIDIFPALFTYWSSIGEDLNTEETKKRIDVGPNIIM